MTEYEIEFYVWAAIYASSFLMSCFLLYKNFKLLKKIDEKYTYINEIFKQYLESEDDKHDAT